ncbi:protein S-acyltransferase 21 [Selaginella moellendorffii]|nr:protein S-acyltransferase 21 [Selaginella moellendorffii]|eukprot:XP_002964704.2 protein S-acyltransferase 21 [Selaginella moellendorffii]
MVRSHGWQLPAHGFQVVAITVFFLLVVAYFVFFAPFIGPNPWQYIVIGFYSILALVVFFLYVRCTGINPADSGVFVGQRFPEQNELKGLVSESSGSVVHRHGVSEVPSGVEDNRERGLLSVCCGLICGCLVLPDNWWKQEPLPTQLDEDVLYCTLCNAEVHKFSKHCRSCDKCVDGFDHHCRWLNNCVGKKNYPSFVALMAASLILLILQWGSGIAVLVRCFVHEEDTKSEIVTKLGNGFTRAPFAAVVATCTLVSVLASVPLGELFFFHVILMRKGITTYEYVVAMRAQNEQQGPSVEGEALSAPSSPGSSTATGITGSSSLGLQYRGAWCTPPRVFIDHQDEVIPHLEPGRVPSTVDPDSVPKLDKKSQKPQVRISAWKLAKLNPTEAAKAAAKARETSSVIKQIPGKGVEMDYSSSDVGSSRSSASTDFATMRGKRADEGRFSASKLVVPRPREEYNIHFDSGDNVTSSRSSISSPRHVLNDSDGLSPLPSKPNYAPTSTLRLSTPRSLGSTQESTVRTSNVRPFTRPQRYTLWGAGKYGGNDSSSLDSLEDRASGFLGRPKGGDGKASPGKKNSVFSYIRQAWPEVSVPASSYDIESGQRTARPAFVPATESTSNLPSTVRKAQDAPLRKADDLLYPENSIFFGGPLHVPGTGKPSSQQHQQQQQQEQQQHQTTRFNAAPRSATESAVFQSGRQPFRGSAARSYSPVFAPRLFNPGGGGYPPAT